ncbi:MAG: carboxylate--amine ligase [Planctomycetota bacterium]|nr:carboxylate--amine ligase [Planctomycetota bacterium]
MSGVPTQTGELGPDAGHARAARLPARPAGAGLLAGLHHEYWPAWLFYAPLFPYLVWLAMRERSCMAFTCVNPGMDNAGGFVGERKSRILGAFPASPHALPFRLLEPGDIEARLRTLDDAIRDEPRLGFPLIIKPECGQRGLGVRLVRSRDDARRALIELDTDAIAQAYHPGPEECGVLWVRRPPGSPPADDGCAGFIYSITRKEFPVVIGDGVSTLGALIHAHPRYRRQARVFRTRLGEGWGRTPARGEAVRLAMAGNHAQGTLFRDGADLVTPALTRAIDALARSFAGGLDVGRFDLRYESDEALRRGEGFGVVELNGASSESTNLYDPARGPLWAYGVLFGLWSRMYELGAWRLRGGGCTTWSLARLVREWRAHLRDRRGSLVSD